MEKIKRKNQFKDELSNLIHQIRLIVFDFDGVFTDNRVLVLEDGREGVFCWRSDGFGLTAVKKLGIKLLVLSTESNPIISIRCQKLNLPCIQNCENKLEVLKSEALKLNISLKEVAYLGNDRNDVECLKEVGFPACVADSYPEVRILSQYVTNARGGFGAVREFCDLIVKNKNGKLS